LLWTEPPRPMELGDGLLDPWAPVADDPT
jgi:hypothetical protein